MKDRMRILCWRYFRGLCIHPMYCSKAIMSFNRSPAFLIALTDQELWVKQNQTIVPFNMIVSKGAVLLQRGTPAIHLTQIDNKTSILSVKRQNMFVYVVYGRLKSEYDVSLVGERYDVETAKHDSAWSAKVVKISNDFDASTYYQLSIDNVTRTITVKSVKNLLYCDRNIQTMKTASHDPTRSMLNDSHIIINATASNVTSSPPPPPPL